MRKLVILLTVAVLLLGCWAGIASSSTRQERTRYLYDKVDQFEATGACSDNEVYSTWIDISDISSSGSVTTSTYKDGVAIPDVGTFTTSPRSSSYAVDKLTRYILGNVANTYRTEPFDTEMTMITYQRTSIPVYVYGDYKDQALDEILLGLPDCFDISYDTSHGRSDPVTPIEMPVAETTLNAIFAINSTTLTLNSTASDDATTMEMDVTPYIKDNRTYTPVRYLAYALGVPEEGIKWDQETQTVTLTKDDTTIKLSIGSTALTKNTEIVIMDVAPELVDPGRTMLPARWVSEALGATVTWDETTQQVTIEIPSSPDQEQGQ